MQRNQADPFAALFFIKPLRQAIHFGLRLGLTNAWLHPSNNQEKRGSAITVWNQWGPKINAIARVRRELKSGRHDSDDRPCLLIQCDRLADQIRIALKLSPPKFVTHDYDLGPLLFFLSHKRTTKRRIDSEQGENPTGDIEGYKAFRAVSARQIKPTCYRRISRNMRKDCALLLPIPERRIRDGYVESVLPRQSRFKSDKLVWFLIRQWSENDCIDNAKYRRVRADAQRQRRDGD